MSAPQTGRGGMLVSWNFLPGTENIFPCLRCWRQWIMLQIFSTNLSIGRSSINEPTSQEDSLCQHYRLWLWYWPQQTGGNFQTNRWWQSWTTRSTGTSRYRTSRAPMIASCDWPIGWACRTSTVISPMCCTPPAMGRKSRWQWIPWTPITHLTNI